MRDLLIAENPDPDSKLPFIISVPLGEGLVFRTSGTWPRTNALYCYPVPASAWPKEPEIVERIPLRSCVRRGAAIDLLAARYRESRSQLVYTRARGRDAVFWQSPRTRKQSRPSVLLPQARAAGLREIEILVDSHERYPYRFAGERVATARRALKCGDYAIEVDGAVVASVERKSLSDLISSLTKGTLRYALGELASLPRGAVVVEDGYSKIFKQSRVRPALVTDDLAECQIRWPNVPILFFEGRSLAEEWTYRFLAAAHIWASTEASAIERINAPAVQQPKLTQSRAEIRVWARDNGFAVSDRGRIPDSVMQAWEASNSEGILP